MADIRINQLPTENNPVATENVAIDGASTRKTTIQKIVDVGAPVASQAEAEAGVNATKRMTPLTVKQSIASEVGVSLASAAQGALAGTAMQLSVYDPDSIGSDVFAWRKISISITDPQFGASLSVLQTPAQRRSAIQAAIDYGALAGVGVLIPAGTWIIDAALRWKTNSKIVGAVGFATILQLSSTAGAEEAILRPDGYDGSVNSFYIADLVLDGNVGGRGITSVTTTQRPGGSCFSLNGAYSGVVERVRAINANLHCFDICGPGEVTGSNRDYVASANMDKNFTFEPSTTNAYGTNPSTYPSGGYYPANAAPWVKFIDCEADNSGDDLFTTHYARYIWLIRPKATNGSARHPSSPVGSSVGIEIDDGSRDIWVTDAYVDNVLGGIKVKCHDHNPASRNIRIMGATIERCNVSLSFTDPYDPVGASPTAKDVIATNIIIRNPKKFAGSEDPVRAIEVYAYQGVIVDDVTIDGNYTFSTDFGNCIIIGDSAEGISITNVMVRGWNPGDIRTASAEAALIYVTGSCRFYTLKDITFIGSGGMRGINPSGTYQTIDNIKFHTPVQMAGSIALLLTVNPKDVTGMNLGKVVAENFETVTSLGGITSTTGVTGPVFATGVKASGGMLSIGAKLSKMISAGALTVGDASFIQVRGEGDANDDLVTINGGEDGDIVVLRASSSTVDIVVKHGTGNIYLDGMADFTLSHALDKLCLINDNGFWCEIGRGNNQT